MVGLKFAPLRSRTISVKKLHFSKKCDLELFFYYFHEISVSTICTLHKKYVFAIVVHFTKSPFETARPSTWSILIYPEAPSFRSSQSLIDFR